MLLGAIADDFTGASDLGNTLAREGMRAVQFVGVPGTGEDGGAEAGIVALKTRSIPPAEAVAQSLAALDWLSARGCRQILFKYCSTFDSTREGNIGPVAEALAARLGTKGVVVAPSFPAAGRTVYEGHLFVHDRLLSESGLEKHPLNPMTDPDIRRWLRHQTAGEVGHVRHATVRAGAEAIRAALRTAPETLVVVDAVSEDDLRAIGAAAADAPLLTGGSGVALGLPEAFRRRGLLAGEHRSFAGVPGPAAVLAGSCSAATRAQVERHSAAHPSRRIDVAALIEGGSADALEVELGRFLAEHAGDAPLVYSSAAPQEIAALQDRHGAAALGARLDGLFGRLARRAVAAGVARLVVAGGETSGAVVSALGLKRLEFGPEIATGVPALLADGRLALALKSGNFGGPDFFERALAVLGGEPRP